jgi:hypothetical protein
MFRATSLARRQEKQRVGLQKTNDRRASFGSRSQREKVPDAGASGQGVPNLDGAA